MNKDELKKRRLEWLKVRVKRTAELLERDEFFCHYCHRPFNDSDWPNDSKLTVDHIVPIVMGGNDELCNLVLACYPCNTRKKDMPYEDFIKQNKSVIFFLDTDRKRAKWLADFEVREFQRAIASNYRIFELNVD